MKKAQGESTTGAPTNFMSMLYHPVEKGATIKTSSLVGIVCFGCKIMQLTIQKKTRASLNIAADVYHLTLTSSYRLKFVHSCLFFRSSFTSPRDLSSPFCQGAATSPSTKAPGSVCGARRGPWNRHEPKVGIGSKKVTTACEASKDFIVRWRWVVCCCHDLSYRHVSLLDPFGSIWRLCYALRTL